jgi:hypothetical protein
LLVTLLYQPEIREVKRIMYTYVLMKYTDLCIPQEKIEQMLHGLLPNCEAVYGPLPSALATVSSPKEKLILVLDHAGYDASEGEQGEMVIEDCAREELDTANDPVLCALAGITPSGSHLTLYGDDNSQWQVRYSDTQKWTVRGQVVFPQEPSVFPCVFEPGN